MALQDLLQAVSFRADGAFADAAVAQALLAHVVAYDTGSSDEAALCKSTVPMVSEIRDALEALGVAVFYREEEYPPGSGLMQASLVGRMGPAGPGGVLLSSHTDVIPVPPDQHTQWQSDPFTLTEGEDERLIGRGAVDMKQALVNILAIAKSYEGRHDLLKEPVYFAFSWGEEIGTQGILTVIEMLQAMEASPALAIINEPTDTKLVTGHKGANIGELVIHGLGGHSALPEKYIHAGTYAAEIQLALNALQQRYIEDPRFHSADFDPPYPAVNAGAASWGTAPNGIPSSATLKLCLRDTDRVSYQAMADDVHAIVAAYDRAIKAEAVAKGYAAESVGIAYQTLNQSPVLPKQKNAALLKRIEQGFGELGLAFHQGTENYGTDAGPFGAAFPQTTTLVCGEGHIYGQNAHAPDEYITRAQLVRGPMILLKMIEQQCLDRQRSNQLADWMVPHAVHQEENRLPPIRQAA